MSNPSEHRDEVCVILHKPLSDTYLIIKSKGYHGGNISGGLEPQDGGDRDLAAIREVREETGLVLNITTEDHLVEILQDANQESLTHVYMVDVDEDCQIVPNPQEVFGYSWLTLASIKRNRLVIRAHHIERIVRAAQANKAANRSIELNIEHKDRSRRNYNLHPDYQFIP